MRIASLVPSATEILFALGAGESVAGVTHECDHPAEARELPHLTRSMIEPDLGPSEIDAEVRRLTGEGKAIYELDTEALASLEVDLILTQAVCEVCAVSFEDVKTIAARLPTRPRVISLDPTNLEQVLGDLDTVAEAIGRPDAGAELRTSLDQRLAAVADAVAGAERERAAALEWLDPVFIGGHWVPEMISIAGGLDVLGHPGRKSATVEWLDLVEARPWTVVVMPCGLYADEAATQAADHLDDLRASGARRIFAVDAASSFSRPGPRLVDGTELLGHLLHPDRLDAPAAVDYRDLIARPVG